MPAYNKSYCQLEGTFSGSEEMLYIIEITNSSGTAFRWRTKTLGEGGSYSSWTTVSSYTLNTGVTLNNGMSVKFTRALKSSYNDNDTWQFRCFPDLKLSAGVNQAYDHLEIIEKGTEKDLVALNSSNGAVTVVKNYESDAPVIQEYPAFSSINQKGYDIVSKNKELYVSGGTSSQPKWIGYTKNGGFDGDLGEYSFVSEPAYNEVTLNSTDAGTFDDHCFLEGGGATFSVGKIIAGINFNDPTLYIQNITDSKMYSFPLGANPLCIRLNTNQKTGTASDGNDYEINGVAVLTEAREVGYINAIEYWTIPNTGTVGQSANLFKYNNIPRPPDQSSSVSDEYIFTDFIIFCETYDAWTSGKKHHLVLSMSRMDGPESSDNEGCVYKYDNGVKDKANGVALDGSDFVDVTPKYGGYPNITANSGAGFCHVSYDADPQLNDIDDIWTGDNQWGQTEERRINTVQNYALAFAGYASDGGSPEFAFTCELEPPMWRYGTSGTKQEIRGLWTDGSGGQFIVLRWVTSIIGWGTTGRTQAPLLAHFTDWGTTPENFESSWNSLNNRFGLSGNSAPSSGGIWQLISTRMDLPPATHPFCCANGTKEGGQKYFFYLDKNAKNGRKGLIQTRKGNADSIRTFHASRSTGSAELWNSNSLWIFPNTHGTMYSTLTNQTAYSRTAPGYVQQMIPLQNLTSGYMALGDRQPWVTLSGNYPAALESWTSMVPVVSGGNTIYWGNEEEALYKHNLSTTDGSRGVTNQFATTVPWLDTTAPAEHGSITWSGPTVKKAFYKFALVYDGYQESTLLNLVKSINKSTDFDKAVTFTIEIAQGVSVPINNRVTAITVYRGDDSEQNSSSPENLYRFVTEIPLYKFSQATNKWTYTLVDSGDVEGTYGALNGIAETMHSLEVKYQLNTALNGYMFVANCSHTQFEDAENVIFRSQPGKYSLFDWSVDFLQIDFVPTAIAGFMGKLYVFGESQLCIVNPESLIIEESIDGIGCIGPKAVRTTPTGLYWFDQTNIYNSKPNISKIGTNMKAQENYGWNLVSADKKKEAVMGYDANRQSVLVFFEHNSTYKVWAFYAETQRWDLWETSHRVYDTTTSSDGYPILLLDEGRIAKYTAGTNKRDWQWNSKKLSLGTDTNYKKVRIAKIDASTRANTSIEYITNDEASYQDGTDVSDNYGTGWMGNAIKVDSNHQKLRWIKLKVAGDNNTSSSNVRGYALGLIYKPKKPK